MSSKGTFSFGKATMAGALASALVVATLGAAPGRAEAQCMPSPTCSRVSPDGKGIVGLGLIGAEIGFIGTALVQEAVGTNEWWPYLVFPTLGAIGGAIGGWGVEQATPNEPEVSVTLLAVGLALVVPTLVGTLALTAYDPAQDAVQLDDGEPEEDRVYEDRTETEAVQVESSDEFGSEPAEESAPAEGGATDSTDGGSSAAPRRVRGSLLAGGSGLLRFDGAARQLLLAVPMVETRSSFTAAERESLRVEASTDVNVPLVSASF